MGKPASLEERLLKLEKLVKELEGGKLPLDDSLVKFEEGILLYKDCKAALGTIEKKIKILTDSLKEEDFEE